MKLVVPLMMRGDPLDAVGRQAFAQRLDDGDAAGHGRLEGHHHAFFLGRREDFIAVRGQQRLVGRDHVLTVGDRLQHQVLGDAVAADELDDDVDLGIVDDQAGVIDDLALAASQFQGARRVQVGDRDDVDAASGAPRDFFLIALQDVEGAGADGAEA